MLRVVMVSTVVTPGQWKGGTIGTRVSSSTGPQHNSPAWDRDRNSLSAQVSPLCTILTAEHIHLKYCLVCLSCQLSPSLEYRLRQAGIGSDLYTRPNCVPVVLTWPCRERMPNTGKLGDWGIFVFLREVQLRWAGTSPQLWGSTSQRLTAPDKLWAPENSCSRLAFTWTNGACRLWGPECNRSATSESRSWHSL